MALSFGRRKLRGQAGGHGCRCRHFHVHYHLPPRRASNFSLRRWLPRLSLLSCVLTPLVLFFAVLAFVGSFVWFTLIYFVASLLNKDSGHGSFKNGSFGRVSLSSDVDGQKRKREAKGKAVKHAAELLAGDSAAAEAGSIKLEIKEVHVDDGFSEVSRNKSRIASSDASLNCEVPNGNDKFVEKLSIFETGKVGMHANADLEGFSGRHKVDDFVDEHDIRLVSGSKSGDSSPYLYSHGSAQIHDLPDMNEVVEVSSDFFVGSNQNMVVPSNTSCHHDISDTNEEYGEDLFEDRKKLSDCTPYGIIDFIDEHETEDQALDGCFAKDEIVGLLISSDGSEGTKEQDAEGVPELFSDSVATLEDFDEQRLPEIPITEADAEHGVAASNEVHDFSNEDETSVLSLYPVCEDTVSSDAPSHHDNGYEDDKQEEAVENNIGSASDPASVACDFVENCQTAIQALDDSANGNSIRRVVSMKISEVEADKVNDNSSSEGAPRGGPLLRRSPSQWWNLCGVVDMFGGSED